MEDTLNPKSKGFLLICMHNVCGKAILMCLISTFGSGYICYKTLGLAPINEVDQVLIHISPES